MSFGSLSYVDSRHQQHVKLHEHRHLTYIQMINFQILQNSMEKNYLVVVHKPV